MMGTTCSALIGKLVLRRCIPQFSNVAGHPVDSSAKLSDKSCHSAAVLRKESPEISKSLQNSLQTRRNHSHHINQKLRTHYRLEAVMRAIQRKLV